MLFTIGVCIIIAGIIAGVAVGLLSGGEGFNLVPSITIWLLSVISGTGVMTVSGSIEEAQNRKKTDEEMLKLIIDKVKNEDK